MMGGLLSACGVGEYCFHRRANNQPQSPTASAVAVEKFRNVPNRAKLVVPAPLGCLNPLPHFPLAWKPNLSSQRVRVRCVLARLCPRCVPSNFRFLVTSEGDDHRRPKPNTSSGT